MSKCCHEIMIDLPNIGQCITPGCVVQLSRFDTTPWVANFGWYAWGGNREVCGWYLTSLNDPTVIKPLQKPDLDDIYCITRCPAAEEETDTRSLPNMLA